jgi:hypothetical protein
MDWKDLNEDGAADGWDINGAKSVKVIEKSDKCATDGSEGFNGGYQRITRGAGETTITQGKAVGATITARGEGCNDKQKTSGCGKAMITIDAIGSGNLAKQGRGINVVIYNDEKNTYESKSFDTYGKKKDVAKMGDFINSAQFG